MSIYLRLIMYPKDPKIHQPVYLEIGDIDPGLKNAVQAAGISRVEVLFYEKVQSEGINLIRKPGETDPLKTIREDTPPPQGQINDLQIGG